MSPLYLLVNRRSPLPTGPDVTEWGRISGPKSGIPQDLIDREREGMNGKVGYSSRYYIDIRCLSAHCFQSPIAFELPFLQYAWLHISMASSKIQCHHNRKTGMRQDRDAGTWDVLKFYRKLNISPEHLVSRKSSTPFFNATLKLMRNSRHTRNNA